MFFSVFKVYNITSRQSYSDLCIPKDPYTEDCHGRVHYAVGGHMNILMCSPNDIVFWLHHCFVDYIWELFRRRQQTSSERQTDYYYTPDVPRFHRANDDMLPFTKWVECSMV